MDLRDKMRIKYGYDTDKLVEELNKEEYNYCKHIKYLNYSCDKKNGVSFFEIKIDTIIGDSESGVINFLTEVAEELGVDIKSITHK